MIITCLLAGVAVQAQDKLPQGKWEVKQINVEEKTDGKVHTDIYNTVAEVKDVMRFPQTLEVKDAKTILLHYPDVNKEVTAEYTLDGDILTIKEDAGEYSYSYYLTTVYDLVLQPLFTEKADAKLEKKLTVIMSKQEIINNNKK